MSNPAFFSFVSRFVDAVTTEPLGAELLRARRSREVRQAALEFAPPTLSVLDGDGPGPESDAFEFDETPALVFEQAA